MSKDKLDVKKIEDDMGFNTIPKRSIILEKGNGAFIFDDKGREYIDCISGHGVALIGHKNQVIVDAIHRQTQKLLTCSGSFYNSERATLLKKIIDITPKHLNRIFFCNSGTESIEAAIKFARFTTKKTEFVCAFRGFHGRTFGALSATFNPQYKRDFMPLVPGFTHVPFNDILELKKHTTDQTAGIILEIVQGEGGIHIAQKDYLLEVEEFCQQKGILLIIDEIQTGFCRTGKMFAIEHYEIKPDLLCLAKGIAGGIPMGAVVCSDQVLVPIGRHGTTFGGNPLACAAANATIDFMVSEGLASQAARKGKYLIDKLQKINSPMITEIRGLGLMIGIELRVRVKEYVTKLQDLGILVLPAQKKIIRLLPPLIITYDQLDRVISQIKSILI